MLGRISTIPGLSDDEKHAMWRMGWHIEELRMTLRDGARAMQLLAKRRNDRIGIDVQAAAAWRARANEVTRYLNRDLKHPDEALAI